MLHSFGYLFTVLWISSSISSVSYQSVMSRQSFVGVVSNEAVRGKLPCVGV